jgi:hypothetical protein
MGEMNVEEIDFISSFVVVVAVVVVFGGGGVVIVDFSVFSFFPDLRRRQPRTADVMTETTMMHKNVMKRRPWANVIKSCLSVIY